LAAEPAPGKRVVMMVGVDGSESSLRARAYAAGLARRSGAHLIMVFVRQIGGLASIAAGAAMIEQTEDEIAAELRNDIERYRQTQTSELEVEFVERSGNPYRVLMELATKRQVDAIFVGASQQAGHRLIGSLAVQLVKNATCPITVVP
jgi:nucleotide-binding universal stress UspA family protein